MNILLVNDDGYFAEGIVTLAKALQQEHHCTIVAPDRQRSACSHSLTMFAPVALKHAEVEGLSCPVYACSGTPADCVKLSLFTLYHEQKPDLIISGINNGANLGSDCLYSGTVSAAMEGLIGGVPSIAISLSAFKATQILHYETALVALSKALGRKAILSKLQKAVLNINVPNLSLEEIKGYSWAPLGLVKYVDTYERNGDFYLLHTGELLERPYEKESDFYMHMQDIVTYTLLNWDLTTLDLMPD